MAGAPRDAGADREIAEIGIGAVFPSDKKGMLVFRDFSFRRRVAERSCGEGRYAAGGHHAEGIDRPDRESSE